MYDCLVLTNEEQNHVKTSISSNLLFQFIFPVVDSDGIIMSVESMNQSLHKIYDF